MWFDKFWLNSVLGNMNTDSYPAGRVLEIVVAFNFKHTWNQDNGGYLGIYVKKGE